MPYSEINKEIDKNKPEYILSLKIGGTLKLSISSLHFNVDNGVVYVFRLSVLVLSL